MVLLVENPAHQCLFAGNDLYRLLITDGFHDFFTTLLHLTPFIMGVVLFSYSKRSEKPSSGFLNFIDE